MSSSSLTSINSDNSSLDDSLPQQEVLDLLQMQYKHCNDSKRLLLFDKHQTIVKYFSTHFTYHRKIVLKIKSNLINYLSSIYKEPIDDSNVHLRYSNEFLTHLIYNQIWTISFIYYKYVETRKKETDKSDSYWICPCSSLLKVWQTKYVSKRNLWSKNIKKLPYQPTYMTSINYTKHIENMKENDIYHKILHEYEKYFDAFETT